MSKSYEFITEYKHKGKLYGSKIYAKTREEADAKLKSKKLTEVILGYDPTSPITVK